MSREHQHTPGSGRASRNQGKRVVRQSDDDAYLEVGSKRGSRSGSRRARQLDRSKSLTQTPRGAAVAPGGGRSPRSPGGPGGRGAAAEFAHVRVLVRVRPVLEMESARAHSCCLRVNSPTEMALTSTNDDDHSQVNFQFDQIFGPQASQENVFASSGVAKLIDNTFDGYSCTVFAYGQTGSGKTYSMSGQSERIQTGRGHTTAIDASSGMMSRAFHYVLTRVKELSQQHANVRYVLRASALEVYNEQVRDLLNPSGVGLDKSKGKGLVIRQSPNRGFFVQNLLSVECDTLELLMEVAGEMHGNRAVGSHELNRDSSRSHSMLTLEIESRMMVQGSTELTRFGKLSFVDLAGSENLKKSKTAGTAAKETGAINKSLFTLGACIKALGDIATGERPKNTHIPYRDSVLTRLLMDSLGGTGMTVMLACLSPISTHREESLRTLDYACRTRNIKNRPSVQVDSKDQLMLNLRMDLQTMHRYATQLQQALRAAGMPEQAPPRLNTQLDQSFSSNDWSWPEQNQPGEGGGSAGGSHLAKENSELKERLANLEKVFVTDSTFTDATFWGDATSLNAPPTASARPPSHAGLGGGPKGGAAEDPGLSALRRTNARLLRKTQALQAQEKELKGRVAQLEAAVHGGSVSPAPGSRMQSRGPLYPPSTGSAKVAPAWGDHSQWGGSQAGTPMASQGGKRWPPPANHAPGHTPSRGAASPATDLGVDRSGKNLWLGSGAMGMPPDGADLMGSEEPSQNWRSPLGSTPSRRKHRGTF